MNVPEVMQRASLCIADLNDGFKTSIEAELQQARYLLVKFIEAAEAFAEDASICGLNTSRIDDAISRVKGDIE